MTQTVLTAEEIAAYLDEVFPQVRGHFDIMEVAPMRARMRLKVTEAMLRPGGTVSGPSLFELADCAFYVAVMGMIGREAMTVTSTATMNFLRKPVAKDLVCEAELLKIGRMLATGQATIWTEGAEDKAVAHATMTYAIPQPA
ncbi:MAG: PaaI family thioesterase [Pseudomonadota bacterium]